MVTRIGMRFLFKVFGVSWFRALRFAVQPSRPRQC